MTILSVSAGHEHADYTVHGDRGAVMTASNTVIHSSTVTTIPTAVLDLLLSENNNYCFQ